MDYKLSEDIVYGLDKATITLNGFFVYVTKDLENFEIVDNPKILVELFNIDELKRYINFRSSVKNKLSTGIDDVVVKDKVIKIVGYEEYELVINFCPAGVIKYIADSIYFKSYSFLCNTEEELTIYDSNVNLIEQLAGIISYYLHTSYLEVIKLPINEIFKLYAVCLKTFPGIKDIRTVEEENNDVQ